MNDYCDNRRRRGWISKAGKILKDGRYRFNVLDSHGFYNHMPDRRYLEKRFRACMGYDLDLDHPKTFNEKLQWLKIYDRKPEYTIMVDKYAVRSYIADKLGEEYLIPLLGVWNDPSEIDFDQLPDRFVLKCNHNSGLGMCICRDKSRLDIKKVKNELRKGVSQNYYLTGREWPYKNVPRKIIAEEYMEDYELKKNCNYKYRALIDYKFFCFNGIADSVMVCVERETGDTKFYFFDKKWELQRYNKRGKEAPVSFTLQKPLRMDEMFAIAEELSKGIPYVRVDLYCIQECIFFSEMTFFPSSGFDSNLLSESDRYWGRLLNLPKRKILSV